MPNRPSADRQVRLTPDVVAAKQLGATQRPCLVRRGQRCLGLKGVSLDNFAEP
jgi:hypothetical protein